MQINRDLLWDYTFTAEQMRSDSFKKWYVARVLTRGGTSDIKSLGIPTIRKYFPDLTLPKAVRDFWEWYFEAH